MSRQSFLLLFAVMALALGGCAGSSPRRTQMSNMVDTTMGTYRDGAAQSYVLVTMTDPAHTAMTKGDMVTREGKLPPGYAKFMSYLARTYGLSRVADWPLDSIDIRCLVFAVDDPARRDSVVSALSSERFVETAQVMQSFYAMGESGTRYNDPYANLQHGIESLQIEQAHRFATGMGVRVAVIDTGLDTQHEDLKPRVTRTRNFVDRDTRRFRADVHGTAVASVIAASADNAQGMVGIAPDASIVSLKACWQNDDPQSKARCNSFTLAKALNFAINERADVINLSLAGPYDPLLERLVKRALSENILVVAAVSDRWPNAFPAAIDGVIAAIDDPAQLQQDQNRILAPGHNILSAAPRNRYDFQNGSSFSAAHLSGVAALVRQRKPHLPVDVVRELLLRSRPDAQSVASACVALSRLSASSELCARRASTDP